MKFHWKELYRDLRDANQSVSWRKLAKAAGVTPSVYTRISKGEPVSVENLMRIARQLPEGDTNVEVYYK